MEDTAGGSGEPEPEDTQVIHDGDVDDDVDSGPEASPPSYVHEASHATAALGWLEAAALDTSELHHLASATGAAARAAGLDDNDPLYRTLESFAWYRLKADRSGGGAGVELQPLRDEGNGWYWPQPVRTVSDEVKKLWADLAAAATDPLIFARANDLCFAGHVGNGRIYAIAAAKAYLQWPTTTLEPLYVALGLVRAWTLARSIGEAALEQEAYDEVAAYAREQIDDDGNPGTVMPLLDALTTPPRRAAGVPPAKVGALVGDARHHYPDGYLQIRLSAMMRRTAQDEVERAAANRLEVQAHLDDAGSATHPAVRMHYLEAAAAAAKRLNVKDLEADAVSELQKIPVDDLQLQSIKASSSLPAYIPESFLRQFDDRDDWREALHHFLHTDSPTGSYARNLKDAQEELERPSLRHLLGGFRLGAHGLPQQSFNDDDERIQRDLVQVELMAANLYGIWYADGLDRIAAAYGVPAKTEITVFLAAAYGADSRLANTFATALHLFWEEEFDASVHLAVPIVEASARALLLALDEPLYRVEQGNSIGQFPGLGFLLPQLLKSDFDPDWERFLGTLLLPRGENIRNLVAHGFLHDVGRKTAALVLRAAGLMAVLAPADGAAEDKEVLRASLRDPRALLELYDTRHPVRARWARVRRSAEILISKVRPL